MDLKGKTSFIPKKPVSSEKKKGTTVVQSAVFIITLIIFILTVVGAGGIYFYKSYLQKRIQDKKAYLEKAKDAFEPSLLRKLKTFDQRTHSSEQLLKSHLAPSIIFSVLEKNILETIRFNNMEYAAEKGEHKLTMKGEAKGFNSIALQSDIFGDLGFFRTPVFANLGVNSEGKASFQFSSKLDPDELLYKNVLEEGIYKKEE